MDLAIATGIFIVFLALCIGLSYYSTMTHAIMTLRPTAHVVAYRYPLKIPISIDGSKAMVGAGLEGVRAIIAVIRPTQSGYRVVTFIECELPKDLSVELGDWIVALTPSGYGVKRGNPLPPLREACITSCGVYDYDVVPNIYPRIVIKGATYAVEPQEFMLIEGERKPLDPLLLSKLKLVKSELVGSSDEWLSGYPDVIMLREEYSQ